MAAQLKRNAAALSQALATDADVLKGNASRLDENYGRMSTQRARLQVVAGKSRGTTWMVIGAVLAVCVSFVVMFLLIRVTGR